MRLRVDDDLLLRIDRGAGGVAPCTTPLPVAIFALSASMRCSGARRLWR
jgi:hypothetical protein